MKTVLLTGTRAPATLDLARRLWREGIRVIGADSVRYPLGRFSKAFASHHRIPPPRQSSREFVESILTLVDKERVDLVWPTCEEIFYLASAHEELSHHVHLFCEPLSTLEPLHHKLDFARFAGNLAPDSWPAEEAPRDRRLVWKPFYSRFAARTRIDTPPSLKVGWMAQEFVEGDEFSSWALCVDGEVRTLTFYQCPARAGLGAGCAFVPMWNEAAEGHIREIAGRLRFTGSLAFDWILGKDGTLRVIECNPRLTSGIHVLDESVSLTDLLERDGTTPPPMRAAQLFIPTLFSSLRYAGTSPDAISAHGDRLPGFTQSLSFAEFALVALRHGIPLTAATTHDIEYNGR